MGLLYRLGICSRQLCLYPDETEYLRLFMHFSGLFQPGGQIAGKFVRHPTIVLTVGAGVSIVIFLPELSADLLEKAVKAGTEQEKWVERTKRIFICPDHT